MATVLAARSNFDEREVDYRSGLSESFFTKMAQQHVFLNQKHYIIWQFNINGPYYRNDPVLGVEGIFVVPFNAEIFDASITNSVAGSGGTTELDVKRATSSGGAFTSIFSTTPKITSSASNYAFAKIGSSVSGVTAPVLNTATTSDIDGKLVYEINEGDGLRFDQLESMTTAQNASLTLYLRSR